MDKLNVIRVKQGENMGDHAETTRAAVEVNPDMTLAQLADALLTEPVYDSSTHQYNQKPSGSVYLEIRAEVSIEQLTRF